MSSPECIRPPTESTFASLCWRARVAVSSLQASAERTPRTLLAAICSPLPEPPTTTPGAPPPLVAGDRPPVPAAADHHAERLHAVLLVGDHRVRAPQAEHRVVVVGVV